MSFFAIDLQFKDAPRPFDDRPTDI